MNFKFLTLLSVAFLYIIFSTSLLELYNDNGKAETIQNNNGGNQSTIYKIGANIPTSKINATSVQGDIQSNSIHTHSAAEESKKEIVRKVQVVPKALSNVQATSSPHQSSKSVVNLSKEMDTARGSSSGQPADNDTKATFPGAQTLPQDKPQSLTSSVSKDHDQPQHNTPQRSPTNTAFPIFHSLPSAESMCHPNTDKAARESLNSFCESVTCMQHPKDVDDELLHLSEEDDSIHDHSESNAEGCKMLWFAAMHESEWLCDSAHGGHAYNMDYTVALSSALKNAHDCLQPVLILGRYGNANENSTEAKKFGRWAEERGAKVVYSPRLSFQEDVDRGIPRHSFAQRQGPFLRLDIPKFVEEHGLLDMPNVCKKHILYTDVDVIFANTITQRDIQVLSKAVGGSMVAYGRESAKKAQIVNTGVMVMNVESFNQEIPKILQNARGEKITLLMINKC